MLMLAQIYGLGKKLSANLVGTQFFPIYLHICCSIFHLLIDSQAFLNPRLSQLHTGHQHEVSFFTATVRNKGSGCGSVGRVVASNTRGPRFESSHQQTFIYILNFC